MAKAKVTVDAGICGFSSRISAWDDGSGLVRVDIESDCEHVNKLAREFDSMDPMSLFMVKAKDSEVFAGAARCLAHQPCPVPIGILKAVEVAAGLALPRDVTIVVEKED